jgi:hypothetical protein
MAQRGEGGAGLNATQAFEGCLNIFCSLASSCDGNFLLRKRSREAGAPSTTVRSLRELQWSPSPASRGRKVAAPAGRITSVSVKINLASDPKFFSIRFVLFALS